MRFLLLPFLAVSVTACATFQPEEERSAYGAFLSARYAGSTMDARAASEFYDHAISRSPGDVFLSERAFVASVIAGDRERAVRAAAVAADGADESRLARLFLAADALSQGRYGAARLPVGESSSLGPFNDYMRQLIDDWARIAAGEADAVISRTRETRPPGFATGFQVQHRALLLDYARRPEEAEQDYRAALSMTPFTRMATELYGDFLEREGRRADAATLYRAYLGVAPGEPSATAALARIEAGGRPPARLNASQSAARALFGPAAALAAQADMDLSVIYMRLVELLDPGYAPTRAMLAGVLDRVGLQSAALEVYETVPDGAFRQGARIERIWLLARMGEVDQAVNEARALATQSEDLEARLLLADLLRVRGDLEESAGIYGDAIAARQAAGQPVDWRYYYFRGTTLARLDRWAEAEALFLQALEVSPNEAEVLNYLGYTWVERGERIEEAFEMLERAVAMEPESGHIIDSLGWAHYALGQYEEAVEALEQAAALASGSATINYHLGDAYWQVGRRLEARFQWERALTLDPNEDEIEGLNARLRHGLPAASETAVAGREGEAREP